MVKNKVKENAVNLVPNCQKKDDGIKAKITLLLSLLIMIFQEEWSV